MKISVRQLVLGAMCLALALFLPFLTGQIPEIGSMISPMHIPVLLCGFLCGGPIAAIVGLIAPLLRSLMFSMPPMFPTATAMAFELAAYGLLAGLFYRLLPKSILNLYVSLILAMLGGRIVWGIVMWLITMNGNGFTFQAFLSGAFIKAWPAILIHIVIIPPIVLALKRAKLIQETVHA
ncbi:ECF transporter S component [Eubacteriales bacterium OttesenSCG-928-N13]|nr:ECF transporter S component [Eubacteriales bacterium OttesenSCG-928-N13]